MTSKPFTITVLSVYNFPNFIFFYHILTTFKCHSRQDSFFFFKKRKRFGIASKQYLVLHVEFLFLFEKNTKMKH